MSSAALHPPSHQQHSLPAQSPPTSAYQYTSAQSPNGEGYHAPSASSPSSRQPSRRPSASQSSPMNPTPTANNGATSDHERSSSRRRHDPPIAPPRTSSSHHPSSTPAASASASGTRRAARAEERAAGTSPRRAPADSAANSASSNSTITNSNSGRPSTNGRSESARMGADDPSSRSRRAASQHVGATIEPSQRPSSSSGREHRQTVSTSMPIRSHPAASSKQPSREASEVLNRVIVSQPEDDLVRERECLDEAHPQAQQTTTTPTSAVNDAHDDSRRNHRSRQDYSKREKTSKFGDYYLGNTIGEGEFGKVKLGWKQDGGVQVAIKLIRRDSVGNNPSRLAKIYREVSILRGISHPNIVRLHEMSETERHIGIVLEYASGGELFDYILNHRYLKDHAARRLFAQLVSGVGYLHKKGIVHRDLKLENLLLDRNRNIIITDFGFANTFDPNDELSEEQELSLADREYVKRSGLDKTKPNGMRRGDLMQTSCGSPCYAAPELVVSDSLYTGRKVDVWSCGVILYAMLAGYLPFDDDPANPEGDNINLLYKYIVNTPLTFPEYVSPHARDLLRRILVPSPRKRADLFEVARHSWLSEYAHVVELITSTTTTSSEIQYTTVPAEDAENSGLARSASVREPSKTKPAAPSGGDADKKAGADDSTSPKQRDSKRRTVQVEYVAPTTQTQRGESAQAPSSSRSKAKGRSSSQGPTEARTSPTEKALPKEPSSGRDAYTDLPSQRKPPQTHRNQASTSSRTPTRVPSEVAYSGASGARPATGGSLNSSGSKGLATRASYGQPLAPAVADTNAHGSIQQPKAGPKNYVISNPIPQDPQDPEAIRPNSSVPSKFAQVSGFDQAQDQTQPQGHNRQSSAGKGHKRSNTIGEISDKIFGRRGSIFGGRKKAPASPSSPSQPGTHSQPGQQPEKSRKYPPISMANNMPSEGRASIDSRASRRSFSMGLNKKPSGSVSGSQGSGERTHNRRFSLLKAVGLSRESGTPPPDGSQQDLPIQDPPQVDEFGRYVEQPSHSRYGDEQPPQEQQRLQSAPHPERTSTRSRHQRFASTSSRPTAIPQYMQQEAVLNSGSESSFDQSQAQRKPPHSAQYQGGYDSDQNERNSAGSRNRVLQKNKRFTDAYDEDEYGRMHDHAGSSGAAKRVMDFFRRRGRARGGEVA